MQRAVDSAMCARLPYTYFAESRAHYDTQDTGVLLTFALVSFVQASSVLKGTIGRANGLSPGRRRSFVFCFPCIFCIVFTPCSSVFCCDHKDPPYYVPGLDGKGLSSST